MDVISYVITQYICRKQIYKDMYQFYKIQLVIMSPLIAASFLLIAPIYFSYKILSKKTIVR